jgi:hypothetical protein
MYQAELELFGSLAARSTGVRAVLLPSEAMFFTQLKVGYFWGIPKSVSFAGMGMDADRVVWAATPLDGDNNKYIQFMLSSGLGSSALEHSVPEQMFSNTDLSAQAVSAVKILQIANDRGIPIFRIDQTNAATILPQLQIDEETKQDIRNAVNARKMVMAPKENIDFHGWTGCGYIILDPNTYAGAYMISGGLNGGILISACGLILILAGLSSAAAFGPALALVILGLLYIGIGICLIEKDSRPLSVFIALIQSIIGSILAQVSPVANITTSILLPIFTTITIYSSDGLNDYCEGQ